MTATQWKSVEIANLLGVSPEFMKPNAAILGYGCNDLSTIFDNQKDDLVIPTPGKISADRTKELDIVKYVTEETVPIFFYHCRYDKYVPVKNTWLLASKLDDFNIPFEMHIFQSGRHGMSVNNHLTSARYEIDSSVR